MGMFKSPRYPIYICKKQIYVNKLRMNSMADLCAYIRFNTPYAKFIK